MSDMETARKAGGAKPLFTTAVVGALIAILILVIWTALAG
jgi:hypothetical protein